MTAGRDGTTEVLQVPPCSQAPRTGERAIANAPRPTLTPTRRCWHRPHRPMASPRHRARCHACCDCRRASCRCSPRAPPSTHRATSRSTNWASSSLAPPIKAPGRGRVRCQWDRVPGPTGPGSQPLQHRWRCQGAARSQRPDLSVMTRHASRPQAVDQRRALKVVIRLMLPTLKGRGSLDARAPHRRQARASGGKPRAARRMTRTPARRLPG